MPRTIAAVMAALFLAGASAEAAAETCDAALSNASPFYCRLARVETARLQLKGSATELGARQADLEQIMHERMAAFSARLRKPATSPSSAFGGNRANSGALLCTLWTVGKAESIALFVECALESAATGDSVEARLLGRTTASEFDMASRVALGQVISGVTARYEGRRAQRIAQDSKLRVRTAGPSR